MKPIAYLAAFAALAGVYFTTSEAHAQLACSAGYQPQIYNWQIGGVGASDLPTYPADNAGPGRRYDNQQKHRRYLLANQLVQNIQLHFDSFDTESGYDALDGTASVSGFSVTGANPSPFNRYVGSTRSLQADPAILDFHSDYSVPGHGGTISSAQVQCNGSRDNGVFTLPYFNRADVLMLGFNDQVTFALGNDPTPNVHYSLAMWNEQWKSGNGPQGQDFDVTVSCGGLAGFPGVAAISSAKSGNQEYLHWTNATFAGVGCAGTYYVTVASYASGGASGQGYTHVLPSKHYAAEHATYKVGLNSSDPTVIAQTRTLLKQASAALYSASNGQTLVDWDFTKNGALPPTVDGPCTWGCVGGTCNVCIDTKPSFCGGGARSGTINWGYCAGEIANGESPWRLVHEIGHQRYGLADYYRGVSGMSMPASYWNADPAGAHDDYNACGHSMMANSYLEKHFCTSFDHFFNPRAVRFNNEKDVLTVVSPYFYAYGDSPSEVGSVPGVAQVSGLPAHSSLWPSMSDYTIAKTWGHFMYEPSGSPDPYDFQDFRQDLAGYPGQILEH